MKKPNLISLAVVLGSLAAISFTSCNKKEGIYNPEGKISKVYSEIYTIRPNGSKDTVKGKELREVWKWDKKQLMSIEARENGYSWTLHFIYDGKQVTKIESGDMEFKFTYEDKNKKFKKIEILDDQARPYLNITVDSRSSDDKITQLTYEQFTYIETKSLKSEQVFISKLRSVASIMMGEHITESMINGMEENAKMRKATTTTKTTTQVELTYEGNNVAQEIRTIITDNKPSQTQLMKYKYDAKLNPYYQAFCLIFDNYMVDPQIGKPNALYASSSENNIESCSYYGDPKDNKDDKPIEVRMFSYKYNGSNFPTERDMQVEFKAGSDTLKSVQHFVHYFEYVTK